jgi:hypothetical protein
MPDLEFWLDEFDPKKFEEGEAAFARGVGLDVLIRQLRIEVKDPNANQPGSAAVVRKWAEDQAQRERNGRGIMLGYLNGVLQSVRRVDQQLMNNHQ